MCLPVLDEVYGRSNHPTRGECHEQEPNQNGMTALHRKTEDRQETLCLLTGACRGSASENDQHMHIRSDNLPWPFLRIRSLAQVLARRSLLYPQETPEELFSTYGKLELIINEPSGLKGRCTKIPITHLKS